MGFSITWCAIRDEAAQVVLAQLGLSPTGATEEIPESLIATAELDTGWRVIWYNEFDCPFLQLPQLSTISKDHDLLMCHVEEHVMASSAEFWSNGTRRWFISHEGVDGPKGLETDGNLPEQFASIRSELEEAQRDAGGDDADVDYIFEIPLRVAQSIVDFRHDETNANFEVLSRSEPKKSFFSKLFKR